MKTSLKNIATAITTGKFTRQQLGAIVLFAVGVSGSLTAIFVK